MQRLWLWLAKTASICTLVISNLTWKNLGEFPRGGDKKAWFPNVLNLKILKFNVQGGFWKSKTTLLGIWRWRQFLKIYWELYWCQLFLIYLSRNLTFQTGKLMTSLLFLTLGHLWLCKAATVAFIKNPLSRIVRAPFTWFSHSTQWILGKIKPHMFFSISNCSRLSLIQVTLF